MSSEQPWQRKGDTRKHSSGYWIKIYPTLNHLQNMITPAKRSLRTNTARGQVRASAHISLPVFGSSLPDAVGSTSWAAGVAKSESDHSDLKIVSTSPNSALNTNKVQLRMTTCIEKCCVKTCVSINGLFCATSLILWHQHCVEQVESVCNGIFVCQRRKLLPSIRERIYRCLSVSLLLLCPTNINIPNKWSTYLQLWLQGSPTTPQ